MAAPRKVNTEIVSLDDEAGKHPTGTVMEEARRLADALRLDARPATARRHGPGSPLVLSDRDEIAHWIGRDIRGPRKPSARVWSLRTKQQVAGVLSELRPTQPKRQPTWAYLDDPSMLDRHGEPLILVGSAGEGEPVGGIFACARHLSIFCDAEDGLRVDYRVHCELIYVAPFARRRAIASSLVATAAMCVDEDLEQLVKAWKRIGAEGPITAVVSGDAYSRGGERAFEGIYSTMACFADMVDGVPIEAQQDWSV